MTRTSFAVLALLAVSLASPSAHAAEVTAAPDEEGVTCMLDLKANPPLTFTATQGSGNTGRIYMGLSRTDLARFKPEDELRMKVILSEDDPTTTYLGYVDEMSGDATFVVPLSLLADMTGVDKFSYRFQNDKPAEVKSFSKKELKQFLACMEKHQDRLMSPSAVRIQ